MIDITGARIISPDISNYLRFLRVFLDLRYFLLLAALDGACPWAGGVGATGRRGGGRGGVSIGGGCEGGIYLLPCPLPGPGGGLVGAGLRGGVCIFSNISCY